jgi:predicted  nucleic acid-binding Zn-ribbon protein
MAAPLRLAALLLLLPVTAGCYLHSAGRDLEQQVELLTARQNEFMATFDQERTRLTELLARAEAQIRQLESALTEAQSFLQRNNADLGERVDAQVAEINALRGRIEEATHQAQLIRDEIQLMREEYDIRFQAMQR